MTRSQMRRRWTRRIRDEERGFTIVETVAALGIVFTLLMSLAYVVTSGFTYQRAARVRQTANALANQLMEQVRGLPYDTIKDGLLSTDLTGDANIVSCDAGATSRLYACTAAADSIPGTAEEIVSSSSLGTTVPLVPHRSSTSPNADPTIDGVTYSWATYVTQDEESAEGDPAPYRVTVEVAWTAVGGAHLVRVQSLFWSPVGCRGTDTHPYAAPCQAFLYGRGAVPAGTITIASTSSSVGFAGTDFDAAELTLPGLNASVQQEQVVQSQSSFSTPRVDVRTSGVTTSYGAVNGSVSADSDPNTTGAPFGWVRCGTEVTCGGATAASPFSAAADRIDFTAPASTTAEAVSSVEAATGQPCPPATVTATPENDALACAAAAFVPTGSLSAVGTIGSTTPSLGTFVLASAEAPSTTSPAPLRVVVDRVASPASTGCAPAADTDGCLALSAARSYGTITIGALPAGFAAPVGWTGYARIVDYADAATVAVGQGSPLASASTPSGTLEVWSDAAGAYETIALDGTITGADQSYTITQEDYAGSGLDLTATFTLVRTRAVNASAVTSNEPTTAGNTERTTATAQVISPIVVIRSQLSIESVGTVMDLTTTANLGTLDLDASYSPQPAVGS